MNIRRILIATVMPVLMGSLMVVATNQVHAAPSATQVAQTSAPSQPPNQVPEGQQRPPRPNFAAAAAKLGVTEQKLKEALGVPAKPPQRSQSTSPSP